jgi:2-oxoisovalerate dehydrogenase E1 component beta subunit
LKIADHGSKLGSSLNIALFEALAADNSVILLGEDIGTLGGVFRITRGLKQAYGGDRVQDFVLAESSIIGAAIGLSLCGFRPICEIQFESFIYPGMNQLVTQAARMQLRSGNGLKLPLVVRVPYGGGFRGVEHHSESNEGIFASVAGLSVAVCSSSFDAGIILKNAIRMDSPCIFYEPKKMYWKSMTLPSIGTPDSGWGARILVEGSDVTVVSYGATLKDCGDAVVVLAGELSIELIDLRWLRPLDFDCVARSVSKTGRLVVVHEASKFCGVGAEVAAELGQMCFSQLKAPISRVTAKNELYPPSAFEDGFLPNVADIVAAIREVGNA